MNYSYFVIEKKNISIQSIFLFQQKKKVANRLQSVKEVNKHQNYKPIFKQILGLSYNMHQICTAIM